MISAAPLGARVPLRFLVAGEPREKRLRGSKVIVARMSAFTAGRRRCAL